MVGYSPHYHAWTIPERRADGNIVGVQLRSHRGEKWMIPGSHRGLILPANWWQSVQRLYLPEGPSDVAAFLSAGLSAIGRPSARNVAGIVEALTNIPQVEVIVVGENDQKPDGSWPGRSGAERCANLLQAALGRPVWISYPPVTHKDFRDFYVSIARTHQ